MICGSVAQVHDEWRHKATKPLRHRIAWTTSQQEIHDGNVGMVEIEPMGGLSAGQGSPYSR